MLENETRKQFKDFGSVGKENNNKNEKKKKIKIKVAEMCSALELTASGTGEVESICAK